MVLRGTQIPYSDLLTDLFNEGPDQLIVPFLGAGVSISAREEKPAVDTPAAKQDPRIARALEVLKSPPANGEPPDEPPLELDETTLLYAEIALEMAFVVQRMRNETGAVDADLFARLVEDRYPPSAGELVALLSEGARLDSFEEVLSRVAKRLGRTVDQATKDSMLALVRLIAGVVGAGTAPLSSISAYYEVVRRRQSLLDRLRGILQNKITQTATHDLVARAAAWHLEPRIRKDKRRLPDGKGDYLIMTTNYDCLMETALKVPYVVLSMSLRDFKIRPRFGNLSDEMKAAWQKANPPRPPNGFTIARPALTDGASAEIVQEAQAVRLAIVYKVHGCIQELREDTGTTDTIVISDNDYVAYISRFSHNDGVIPVCVSNILKGVRKPMIFFLGYSLSDWNIRGMLRAIRAKRAGEGNEDEDYGDYTVVRNFSPLDDVFFTQNKIRIIHEDLKVLTPTLESMRERRYGP